jgi:hypothetical protein
MHSKKRFEIDSFILYFRVPNSEFLNELGLVDTKKLYAAVEKDVPDVQYAGSLFSVVYSLPFNIHASSTSLDTTDITSVNMTME